MNNFENKKLSMPLVIGILMIPIIFAWFTLRNGYSNTARIISFGWLILGIVLFALLPEAPQSQVQAIEPLPTQEQSSAVVTTPKTEAEITADAEAAHIRKQFEERKAELAAADRPRFEAPTVDYTSPVAKINIKDDTAILKAVSRPVVDSEKSTNENGEPMTSHWFSKQPAYGLEISLSREFIDVAWQFDSKNPEQAAESFNDGQRITRALLGGQDGSALYEKISKGEKFDQLILEDGTEVRKARCGERICRYQIVR